MADEEQAPVPEKKPETFGLRTAANRPPDAEARRRAEAILGRPAEDYEIDYLWQSGWL